MKNLKQLIKDKKILEVKALILDNLDLIEESIDIILGEIDSPILQHNHWIEDQIKKDMSEVFEQEFKCDFSEEEIGRGRSRIFYVADFEEEIINKPIKRRRGL